MFSKSKSVIPKRRMSGIRVCTNCHRSSTSFDSYHDEDSGFGLFKADKRRHPAKLIKYKTPKVVIIGAGVAGITAAGRLAERGVTDITVLEAYERPGGRIQSSWIADSVVELGSDWTPGIKNVTLANKLLCDEDPPQPYPPGGLNSRGLFLEAVPGKAETTSVVDAYLKFKQIQKETLSLYSWGSNKQQGSLLNFMSMRIQQELNNYPEHQQLDAARILFGLLHMVMAKSDVDKTNISSDIIGNFIYQPPGAGRVPLGLFSALAPSMCSVPAGCIKFCKPVRCVFWGTSTKVGYRALVHTCDGEEYPADYVICTVSASVLKKLSNRMFCPQLPASKGEAFKGIGGGFINKIFLGYGQSFYFWQPYGLHLFNNHKPIEPSDYWTGGIIEIKMIPRSQRVICCTVSGIDACNLERVCDQDVVEGITSLIRRLTGNQLVPYPEEFLRSSWTENPYFYESFPYDKFNTNGHINRVLAEPVPSVCDASPPVLLFAGDATCPDHCGSVDGARLSGLREAERIIGLTVKLKGPPTPQTTTTGTSMSMVGQSNYSEIREVVKKK